MKSLVWVFVLVLSFASTVLAQNGGYALKFNGTDGAATMNLSTGNTNSTATIEMWFTQVTAQAGTQFLGDLHSISGINRRRVMPYLNSGTIGIYCAPNTGDDNNAITQSTGVTVSTNVWYHIAVTINGSTLKMYVNGKLYVTTSLTTSYALTGTEVLTLAKDYWDTTYANIKLDEVRVWSTERTEAQIKANMYKELAGSEAGLLSYYKMSNGSGSSISDNQTAGSYGGTLSGGYSWVASGAFADNRNALDFDGSNDYVDCGNSASVQRNGTQNFTVEAWVKPTGGVWVAVISKFVHTASNEGYSLEIFSDNKVSLLYGNNWSDWNATTSSTSLTPGVWSHIAATYDGTTVKVYINGLLTQSATWTNGLTDSGTNLLLGSRSGTTFYSGQMDEVRVWTIARTADQIREDMCKTLVGNEAGLTAYYRLDQIDGSTTYDLTSNGNNGTLTNMDPSTDWVTSDAFDTWIGAESSSWSDAGNWSKGAAPTSSNSVGLYKWALGNETTISTSPTINNLLISSTASPTLSSSMTVNMNLLLEKDFNLNGQTVTLGSTANLVEGNYRLYGTSGTISTTRTLSNIAVLDVAGLGAKISTTANLGSTTITRGHAQQTGGSGNVSILRYYDITPTNNSSLNAALIFSYKDAELNSLTENNFALYKSTDGGTTWTNQGGALSTVNNTVTKTGISSFSRWTVGDSSHPLSKTTPVITFGAAPTPTYLGGNFTVSASTTNTDSTALTYSRVSGPCAFVSGATFSSTGVGTCVVQADGAATTNFNAASQTQSIAIGKATPVITFGAAPTPTYLGGNFTVSASTTNTDSTTLTYSRVSGPCAFVSGATFSSTGAGTCVVQADGAATTNFNAASQTQSIVISKATTTIALGNLSHTYDGTLKSATAATTPPGLAAISITYDGSATPPTNAGSYAVVASLSNPNYQATNATGTLVISKATATIALGNLSHTYDGTLKSATAATTPPGLAAISITYDGSATPPTNAGSYAVVASLSNPNYQATNAIGTLVISKATSTITLGNLSQTYDGTPKSATAATTPPGLAAISITYDGSATPPTNAGSYGVVASLSNPNYQATNATGTLVISKATATITLGNLSHTYDGTPKSATATTTQPGLTVNITYNGSAWPPTNVGSYAVVATINDPNYQGTANGTLVIAKATATITLSNLNHTYDGTPKSATTTTAPPGLTIISITYDGSATPPTNAGSYGVVASLSNANYQATNATGTLVISKATATITLGNLNQTYDGTPKSATATTNPPGLTVSITYNGSGTPPTNAGSYAVIATINDANYQGTANGTLVISKGTATITLGNLNQTYDGTPKSATATTNPPGLTVSITYNGSGTPPTNAGSYAVIATINDPNYQGTANGTLTIARANTTTALTSSKNPSLFSEEAMFTATVSTVVSGIGTPTGTATFKNGTTVLEAVPLSGSTATLTTSSLPSGDCSITAEYGGDEVFSPSTSAVLTQKVEAFDLVLTDEYGRAELRVNTLTGDWSYTILTGSGAGNTYTGTGRIVRRGEIFWLFGLDSEGWGLNLVYNETFKKGMATFGDTATETRSSMIVTGL